MESPIGMARVARIERYHADRCFGTMQISQQVRQQDRWLSGHCSRHCYTLLLTA
jgi:hypothetical protein